MLFTKDDLIGNYKWGIEPINSLFTGFPTRRIFNRWNGVQVLFIINAFAALSETFSIEEVRKVESLINNFLTLNTSSELTVFNWLRFKAPKD